MTPELWQQVEPILAAARRRAPEERAAFLDQACTDPWLRRQVDTLLAVHEHAGLSVTQRGTPAPQPGNGRAFARGTRLGRYEILASLGAGGMGIVYHARDSMLEREVAVKVLPPETLHDDAARRRFHKEALALARLNHPNIASVFDAGAADGVDFLVMEYVAGQPLDRMLESGPLPTSQALSLAGEIAAGLTEAHDHGIVHRDLKPANIIVTPRGHAKVLDFGLAMLFSAADGRSETLTLSGAGAILGTPLYMSPEQARGDALDARTDLWSLGALLYESLAGQPPFPGHGSLAVLQAIVQQSPKPLRELRPGAPAEVERIVLRALEKDPARRYPTAEAMTRDLTAASLRLSAAAAPAPHELRISLGYATAAGVAFLLLAGGAGWLYHRAAQRRWVGETAIPKIEALQRADSPLAAYLLLRQAEKVLPGDPQLARIAATSLQTVSIHSTPPGATVEIKDYLSPKSGWYRLGATPLEHVPLPRGYFRWRVAKPGAGEFISAPETQDEMRFPLAQQTAAPPNMVWVPGENWSGFIEFVGMVGPDELPPYYLDRFEVTNREYQKFVDAGGYDNPKYWTQPLVENGRTLSWSEARTRFRDSTGRPGPSTWEGGHFPAGRADYPVSGVSWYEAAAYAVYAGKSLPAFAQWYAATALDVTHFIVRESNISLSQPEAAGRYRGLGPDGTYDMAGNVREWVLNSTGSGQRFILGGAADSPSYLYGDPEALSPWDRSIGNGFRCVRNSAPLTAHTTGAIHSFERDFSKAKPVSDDVFRAYASMYTYDPTPLNATTAGAVQETEDWREEKITYDAAYNGERMAAYLFLPKKVKPPYQTVVFNPSARVLDIPNSSALGDIKFFDYVVQSGRAVLYPVYKGEYERQDKAPYIGAAQTLMYYTDRSKDLGRSLDYLQTRPDIDARKLAYLGVSMGAAEGVIYATIAQSRLKTAVFLDGGFFLDQPPEGADQAAFAPRLKIPVLMVNGSEDYVFSLTRSQNPLFQMLGAPAADKRHVVFETPHDVTGRRQELIQAVTGWLDQYLGPIQ